MTAMEMLCKEYDCKPDELQLLVTLNPSLHKIVSAMEQMQPKMKPVSEGLPERPKSLMITSVDCLIQSGTSTIHNGFYDFVCDGWYSYTTSRVLDNVIAWAYITKPEPIKIEI